MFITCFNKTTHLITVCFVQNEDAATTLDPIRNFAESFKSKRELLPLDHWTEEGSNFPTAGVWHPSVDKIFTGINFAVALKTYREWT